MLNSAAVTVVKIRNLMTGTREICAHRLMTSAVEQPMIKRPPIISPQRTLLSSMNAVSTSANGLRGGFTGGGGNGDLSESLDQLLNWGAASERTASSNVLGVMYGGPLAVAGAGCSGTVWAGAFVSGIGRLVTGGVRGLCGRPCGNRIRSRSAAI